MKKTIKLALVLSTIALLAVSCSVQTHSLVGFYDNGKTDKEKFTMYVYDNGSVGFTYYGESVSQDKITTKVEDSLTRVSNPELIPWDLATSKINQTYDVKVKYTKTSSFDSSSSSTKYEYVSANLKYTFTLDGDNIKCDIELSGLTDADGKTGTVTVTKKIK